MLIVMYFCLIIFSFIITRVKYNMLIGPNTIFTVLWCLGGIVSIINKVGIIKPSLQVHLYIIITVLTFNLVYFLFYNKKGKRNLVRHEKNHNQINHRLITFLMIIGLMLISPNTWSALQTLLSSGFSLMAVRENYAMMTASGNFLYVYLTTNIPIAIFGAASLIVAIELVNNRRRLLFITIFCLLIATITFGGRYLIMNFIIYYISGYILLKKYKKIRIKKSYILFAIILLATITISRGTSGLSVLEMVILYYVGSFSFLEFILANPEMYGLTSEPLYGYLTFGFILEPIVLGLKLLFNVDADVPSYYFNIYAQGFVNIGDTIVKYYNNNTTMLYTFIRDFKTLGIVIGPAILAFVVSIAQKRYEKTGGIRSLYILVLMFSVIFNSTMMYTLTSISASFLIFFLMTSTIKISLK